ncbi:hypothetical protein BBV17_13760 [Cytobacillus oceanisediminis]|uniref:Uncharacterized protein n=1 Tax=Cytobacillus oceanisediminis TaxID=665099 RepID=A0ABX3CV01_9BACI|nr:hypothetical protein BBV17_13760 [Cytobacillus oceanisediminis]
MPLFIPQFLYSLWGVKSETLRTVIPFLNYGLQEATMTYLLGKGYDPQTAFKTVESWEVNKRFY